MTNYRTWSDAELANRLDTLDYLLIPWPGVQRYNYSELKEEREAVHTEISRRAAEARTFCR